MAAITGLPDPCFAGEEEELPAAAGGVRDAALGLVEEVVAADEDRREEGAQSRHGRESSRHVEPAIGRTPDTDRCFADRNRRGLGRTTDDATGALDEALGHGSTAGPATQGGTRWRSSWMSTPGSSG
jgi:hypothetical protein